MDHSWLVGGFKYCLFSISYMGCHPQPIDEVHIFQDGYCTTKQIYSMLDDRSQCILTISLGRLVECPWIIPMLLDLPMDQVKPSCRRPWRQPCRAAPPSPLRTACPPSKAACWHPLRLEDATHGVLWFRWRWWHWLPMCIKSPAWMGKVKLWMEEFLDSYTYIAWSLYILYGSL